MQHSKIEWLQTDGKPGYSVNPVKGYCPVGCPYCYARRMYDRFKWDKTIRYADASWFGIDHLPPSRIFVGSTIELFGDWVITAWMNCILDQVKLNPQHTFIFLTKQPQNLQKYSPYPPNAWVGVSVDGTDNAPLGRMLYTGFGKVQATVKFISFEPLLANPRLDKRDLSPDFANIQWVILGAETGNRKGKPPLEQVQGWAREIIRAADKARIPVFVKNNLTKLSGGDILRQEWPRVGGENATQRSSYARECKKEIK